MNRPDFIFATVNASQVVAKSWNLGLPDITLFGAGVLDQKPVNIAAKSVLHGQRTRTLVFVGGTSRRSFVVRETAINHFGYDKLVMIKRADRRRVIKRVTGRDCEDNQTPSNGIFLAILSLYLQSPKVVMSGFSLTKAGHSYNNFGHSRAHTSIDGELLAEISRRKLPLFTNDPVFATESGLTLDN
jgi:hypothetical protein